MRKRKLTWRQKQVGETLTKTWHELQELKKQAPNKLDEKYIINLLSEMRRKLRMLGVDPFEYVSTRNKPTQEPAENEKGEDTGETGDDKEPPTGDEGELGNKETTGEEGETGDDGKLSPKRLTKEQAAQIKEAYKTGMSIDQISDHVNIVLEKVQSYIEKQGREKLLADD